MPDRSGLARPVLLWLAVRPRLEPLRSEITTERPRVCKMAGACWLSGTWDLGQWPFGMAGPASPGPGAHARTRSQTGRNSIFFTSRLAQRHMHARHQEARTGLPLRCATRGTWLSRASTLAASHLPILFPNSHSGEQAHAAEGVDCQATRSSQSPLPSLPAGRHGANCHSAASPARFLLAP